MSLKLVILCTLIGVAIAAPKFIFPSNSFYYTYVDPAEQVLLLRARRSPQLSANDLPVMDTASVPQGGDLEGNNVHVLENMETTSKRRPIIDDDEDEDDSPATTIVSNTFFPVTAPASQPGGALAIANSFSVKGDAISHAIAYGYPQEQKRQ